MLAATGCRADTHTAAPQPDTSAPPQLVTGTPPPLVPALPLPQHAVDDAVAQLDGLAAELMASSKIPGMAVAVVHGGKTIYAKGFGVKDVRRPDDRVDPDTVFQLASLSKSLSATVAAHQVGIGSIGWNTPLISRLPWFALSDPAVTGMVTIGDMFAHRSGLPDHAGDLLEDLGYDQRSVLDRLRQLPLDPFRVSYAYTNFGFTAAAEAIAAAAGTPWDRLCDDVLFRPLGMTSTSARFADYLARSDRAVGHIHIDGGYEPLYQRDADAQAPAGGVSSSVTDMAHWLALIMANGNFGGHQLVDSAALLPALSPQIVSNPPSEPAARAGFYGFGFNIGTTSAARTQISHSGAFELGAGTNFLIIPSADVAIIALTNATPAGVAETLTAEFADLVQFGRIRQDWRTLYGNAFAEMEKPVGELVGRQPPTAPAPAAPLTQYAGRYGNQYWGPATVTERNGSLTLTLGPRGSWPLRHWDGNTFTFSPIAENAPPGSVSKAIFDGNRLTLEYYDDGGRGVFVR